MADELAQLVTRFFRGEASKRVGSPGTGLGLAIAKEIVDLHDGEIEVHSTGIAGEGTAVTVWLPVEMPLDPVLEVNDF
jgi:signal transduction histidine kinase